LLALPEDYYLSPAGNNKSDALPLEIIWKANNFSATNLNYKSMHHK